ncbi:MAG: serine--tRNA ligase [Chitinophagales bacterium]|nr:serine--tRNA ligase [Chitinophagales bacterium]
MLQLSDIRNNTEELKKRLAKRSEDFADKLDSVIALDDARKEAQHRLNELQSDMNSKSKSIGDLYKEGKTKEAESIKNETTKLKESIKEIDSSLSKTEEEIRDLLVTIPNAPHESVPKGNTDQDNEIIKKSGEPREINNAVPHWDLADKYKLFDLDLGSKLTGAGFPVYLEKGAKLQRALINWFLDSAIEAGYTEVIPPLLVNGETAFATGQLPDKEGQMYEMKEDPFYLIPTAEVPITNLYRDRILVEEDFPVKMVGYTPCFRREAGSYGKDVRGLNRVHQFDKVEIVQIQHPDKSYATLDEMVSYVEGLVSKLGLTYRIARLCSGDLGFTSALTYDMEVYSVAQEKWLEVSSISNFEAFQSNRLKLRYKNRDKKNILAHTLNGSAIALPRIVAALLENNQTDQGIIIPEVLQPYTGFKTIS